MQTEYWPSSAPRNESLGAFIKAFESIGYELADDVPRKTKGYERITLYALNGRPTHAAKQLPNGKWSSKLGGAEDIEHTLTGLHGEKYGKAVHFMPRPVTNPGAAKTK